MSKILIIAGYAPSLYNFRGELIKELVKNHEVITSAPFLNMDVTNTIESLGTSFHPHLFRRTGLNIFQDCKAYFHLKKLIKSINPDYIIAYTVKPVIYGTIAAKSLGVKRIYTLITGLGSGFNKKTMKERVISWLITVMYRRALKDISGVIFQNPDDKAFFLENHIIGKNSLTKVVNGSGVNLDHFVAKGQIPLNPIRFLLIARMVREKGVGLFVKIARNLKKDHLDTCFQLLGWVDENPNSYTLNELMDWQKEGIIEYLGAVEDVRPFIESSSVFVLPTYYGEGTPRTILEAMAMGRPIITTRTSGCKETTVDGENGFLIAPKSVKELEEKIRFFIENPGKIRPMGRNSLELVTKKYDVKLVNKELLTFMEL